VQLSTKVAAQHVLGDLAIVDFWDLQLSTANLGGGYPTAARRLHDLNPTS
jgi:hypothetical protein